MNVFTGDPRSASRAGRQVRAKETSLSKAAAPLVKALAALLTALFALDAFAQNSESEEQSDVVVVTATRLESDTAKVGSSVTVITSEELERKQHRYVLDALRAVPGIDIRQSGSTGSQTSIFMRGTDSDHTLLLIDGIQVHDVSAPNGAAVISNLPISGIERIEVVRGPQSTLYGSDAIGGVINIITKKGEGANRTTLTIEGGSYASFSERLSMRGSDDRFSYALNAARSDTDGIPSRPTDSENDGYHNTALSTRFGYQATDNVDLQLYARFVDSNLETDSGGDPLISETDTQQYLFKFEPSFKTMDGRWGHKLGAWVHDIQRKNKGSGFGLPADRQGTIYGLDWQNDVQLLHDHTLTFGADAEWQQIDKVVAGVPNFDKSTNNVGVYLQDNLRSGEAFNATLGLRFDEHDQFGGHTTYRATAVYDIQNTGTTLRGSVGTGFKAPTLSELFDDAFGSNNPNLNAEESFGFDAGVEQNFFDDKLTVGTTFFYNDIDDMIVAVFDGSSFVNENVDSALTQGAESFVRLAVRENLSLRLRYTYTHTEAKAAASFGLSKGSRLLRRPYHNGSAEVRYAFLDNRAEATLSYIFVGERRDLDPVTFGTVTADDYHVANLAGSYAPKDHLKFFARVNNLFDTDYEEVLGFNTPGINAAGGVSITF